jgi:hypothetical protein
MVGGVYSLDNRPMPRAPDTALPPAAPLTPAASTEPPHWLVPFAASLSEPCQHALPYLDKVGALPHWARLMSRLSVATRLEGDEYALSMPHERVLGEALGWAAADQPDADGRLPWAAWWAAQDALALDADLAWGLLSPGHWLMGRDHLTLLDPQTLGLGEVESRTVFNAIQPLFEDDGWTLRWGSPQRWYAAHPTLTTLPTASLDRVIGRNPDVWLGQHPEARTLRRLQSEVQMLLYQHPVNDAREAAGLATVNSFWLSGCGLPPATLTLPAHLHLVDTLRAPLLSDDMPSWLEAWQAVDDTVFKAAVARLDAGLDLRLTFCGERHALTLAPSPRPGFGARLWRTLNPLARGPATPMPSDFLSGL